MIHPFIHFNGQCRDAVNFYADTFNVEVGELHTFGQLDPNSTLEESQKNQIAHTELTIFGCILMLSDCYPLQKLTIGENFSISINLTDKGKLVDTFNKLKDNGEILMDLTKTPWSDCYGMLKDKFGVVWQFNLEKL